MNPKVAIFFLSFLPQFVDPTSPLVRFQLFGLGAWFATQGTLVLVVVSLLFGKTAGLLKRSKTFWNIQRKVTGFVLVGLGVKLAVSTR